jgi:phosphatidylglycerol:prolipoprotein diacylglycerol transferase
VIPYFKEPVFHAGRVVITSYAASAATAIAVSGWTTLRRGCDQGIPAEGMFRLWFWMCACAVAGALAPGQVQHPGEVSLSTLGAICGGPVGAVCWALYHRLSVFEVFRRLEIMAYTFPLAWMFGRFGCTLAHDHRGVTSLSWLAVQFPEGPRWDLGFLEFLFLAAVGVLFRVLDRRPRPVGFFFVSFALLYAGFRGWIDTLREQPHYLDVIAGLCIAAAGIALMRVPQSAEVRPAPGRPIRP